MDAKREMISFFEYVFKETDCVVCWQHSELYPSCNHPICSGCLDKLPVITHDKIPTVRCPSCKNVSLLVDYRKNHILTNISIECKRRVARFREMCTSDQDSGLFDNLECYDTRQNDTDASSAVARNATTDTARRDDGSRDPDTMTLSSFPTTFVSKEIAKDDRNVTGRFIIFNEDVEFDSVSDLFSCTITPTSDDIVSNHTTKTSSDSTEDSISDAHSADTIWSANVIDSNDVAEDTPKTIDVENVRQDDHITVKDALNGMYDGVIDTHTEEDWMSSLPDMTCITCGALWDLLNLKCSDTNCQSNTSDTDAVSSISIVNDESQNNWASLTQYDGIEMSFTPARPHENARSIHNVNRQNKKRKQTNKGKKGTRKANKTDDTIWDKRNIDDVLSTIRKTTSDPKEDLPEFTIIVGEFARYTVPEFTERSPDDVEKRWSLCRLDGECPYCKMYRIAYESKGRILEDYEQCLVYSVMEEKDREEREYRRQYESEQNKENAPNTSYNRYPIANVSGNLKTYRIE